MAPAEGHTPYPLEAALVAEGTLLHLDPAVEETLGGVQVVHLGQDLFLAFVQEVPYLVYLLYQQSRDPCCHALEGAFDLVAFLLAVFSFFHHEMLLFSYLFDPHILMLRHHYNIVHMGHFELIQLPHLIMMAAAYNSDVHFLFSSLCQLHSPYPF